MMIELPVDWFDSPESETIITNNDLDPTPLDPGDYAPFWDTEREWVEPHPDMEGFRCSAGWLHVAWQRAPVPPVGLSLLVQHKAGLARVLIQR